MSEPPNGKEFKNRFGNFFFKVLRDDLKHNNFQYELGLNKDTQPFTRSGKYGLHFCLEKDIRYNIIFGSQLGIVNIPDDATVYEVKYYEGKYFFRTNMLFLEKLISFEDYLKDKSLLDSIKIARNKNLNLIKKIFTEEEAIEAVNYYGIYLQFINKEKQTEKICLAALKKNPESFYYVRKDLQTYEMAKLSLRDSAFTFTFIRKDLIDQNLCEIAFCREKLTLSGIEKKFQTQYMIDSLSKDEFSYLFKYVDQKFQTYEICLYSVKKNFINLRYVRDDFHTEEIYLEAFKKSALAHMYMKKDLLTEDLNRKIMIILREKLANEKENYLI